jgi:ubiquinone/menaquinone biosynthesis C-methylase UbiE
MSIDQETKGNRERQAEMWGRRAQDWAEVMEGDAGWGMPLYEQVLDRAALEPGARVLDVGCGSGRFARLAAERGYAVSGLDATPQFVEIARSRVPEGDFREGEMEDLPWDDDGFDLVTGFNSFFLAADMPNALREARRVAKPGALVATSVFGRPERCDSTAVFRAVGSLVDRGDGGGDDGPGLHEEGVLEEVAERAGLRVVEAGFVAFEERYADFETLMRGYGSAPPFTGVASAVGEDAVLDAVAEASAGLRRDDGYVLREEAKVLIAAA